MTFATYLSDVGTHLGFGALFGCTGACARGICKHKRHQIMVGGAFIVAEAFVMVAAAG